MASFLPAADPVESSPAVEPVTGTLLTAWVLTGITLVLIPLLHLVSALVAGLLVYELVGLLAPIIERHLSNRWSRLLAVGTLALLIIGALIVAGLGISALNTVLTALFIFAVLPALGIHLPLSKTLIAVTFFAGLLPVVGNLISNTAIFIAGLSVSIYAALFALIFLVVIHKLEYFFNARIVGSSIYARAWELLVAMLVMEVAFGISGVLIASFYYAYVIGELMDRTLV